MAFRPIQLAVRLFAGPDDLDRSRSAITTLLLSLVVVNRDWMLRHPGTPDLYDSHVIYKPEDGTEIWQDIPTTLELGYGDCEDLAVYRCGVLQAKGILATPLITWRQVGGRTVYHALVKWPDGKVEDPSLARGMRGHPVMREPLFVGTAEPEA